MNITRENKDTLNAVVTIDIEKKEYLIELKDINGKKVKQKLVSLKKGVN